MAEKTRRNISIGSTIKLLTRLGRKRLVKEMPFIIASMIVGPKRVMRYLMKAARMLEKSAEFIATWKSSNGEHPRHRLTDYHKYFVKKISAMETVLDIGCGNGSVAIDIADSTGAHVIGIDKDSYSIQHARKRANGLNVEFICGDALSIPLPPADVIVLSNVLEHIRERVLFLQGIRNSIQAKRLLLRVPQYERSWMVPFEQELDIDTRLDPTHFIEHRQEEIIHELEASGWKVKYIEARWGEYRIEAEQI
jgi:2-polyprenyl-3-methyl-5-hydroxy-6-metoxy-1,4-benzoquinol methylase